MCDIDRSHYSGMERGERNPSLSMILKIAAILGVPASEVLARGEAIRGRGR